MPALWYQRRSLDGLPFVRVPGPMKQQQAPFETNGWNMVSSSSGESSGLLPSCEPALPVPLLDETGTKNLKHAMARRYCVPAEALESAAPALSDRFRFPFFVQ